MARARRPMSPSSPRSWLQSSSAQRCSCGAQRTRSGGCSRRSPARCLSALTESYAVQGLYAQPGSLPGAGGMATIASSSFIPLLILIGLVCSLTPDGWFLSPRWQRASQEMVLSGVVWFALRMVAPGPLEEPPFESVENPLAVAALYVGAVRVGRSAAHHGAGAGRRRVPGGPLPAGRR